MASILFWLFVAVISFVAGAILVACWLWLYDLFRFKIFKPKIEKDPEKRKEQMLDPGKKTLTEKEVEEHERSTNAKFREFEKLRRVYEGTRKDAGLSSNPSDAQRASVSYGINREPPVAESELARNKGNPRKGIRLTNPADIRKQRS